VTVEFANIASIRSPRQLEQQFDGLINDAVFRVVETQTCRLDGHALAAFRRGKN